MFVRKLVPRVRPKHTTFEWSDWSAAYWANPAAYTLQHFSVHVWVKRFVSKCKDARQWYGIPLPFHPKTSPLRVDEERSLCREAKEQNILWGSVFPPLAFPLTVLWTLRPEHTWVFHGPGYSKEPSLPLQNKPQSKAPPTGRRIVLFTDQRASRASEFLIRSPRGSWQGSVVRCHW